MRTLMSSRARRVMLHICSNRDSTSGHRRPWHDRTTSVRINGHNDQLCPSAAPALSPVTDLRPAVIMPNKQCRGRNPRRSNPGH